MFLSCICFTSVQRLLIFAYLPCRDRGKSEAGRTRKWLTLTSVSRVSPIWIHSYAFLISPSFCSWAHLPMLSPGFLRSTVRNNKACCLTHLSQSPKYVLLPIPREAYQPMGQRMSLCLRRANLGKLKVGEAVCGEIFLVLSCEQGTHSNTHRKVT